MSWSNLNCCTEAKASYAEPDRSAAANSTSSTSVTFLHSCALTPNVASTLVSTSTQTNVAACPRWVTSYGVMPQQ